MPHSPPASGLSYPSTQRDGPPHGIGGYPPPVQQDQFQPQFSYLLPLQPTAEPPPGTYPPPDQRRGYYRPPGPAYGRGPYPSGPYYAYRGQQPQGPQPPNGFRDYRAHRGPGAAPRPTRAAPGQRTLIACQYCRTRKIRCSGYQSAPEGKCQNCVWKNQPCIFQLVSSTNSTPFVPLPAVPGGVLPGTQLFGAHGQPLAPSSVPAPHPSGPQQRPLPAQLPPLRDHYAPAQTPTEPFSPTEEARADGGSQVSGERRRRTSEEPDEGCRLATDGTPSRRPSGEFSNHSRPGRISPPPYPGTKQNPRNTGGSALPQPVSGALSVISGRSVMSLSNLVEKNDMN